MYQQSTLNRYFKSKALPLHNMSDENNKRRSLSLKKPSTSRELEGSEVVMMKAEEEVILVKQEEDFIVLSSDSDHDHTPAKRQNIQLTNDSEDLFTSPSQKTPQVYSQSSNCSLDASNSSATTFVYTLSPGSVWQSPQTPSKVTCSPGSSQAYYSPTKKRLVKKRSPARRNLANQFKESSQNSNNGYKDDKTDFMFSLIDTYLKNDNIKHLLHDCSQALLEKCMNLVNPGLRVLSSLYRRQDRWYSTEELGKLASKDKDFHNTTIFSSMINGLVENGLIIPIESGANVNMDFDDYVKLLKKPDVQQICKDLKIKTQSKQDAVQALKNFCNLAPISNFFTSKISNNRTRVLQMFKSKLGQCYKISDLARTTIYNLYVLMYLGINYSIIREKKLDYVLILDKIKKETYPIDKNMEVDNASVVFKDRAEFYRYLEAHKIYEMFLEKTEVNEKCEIVKQSYNMYKGIAEEHMLRYKSLPIWLRKFTPANIYIKILENGIQELKKIKTEENYNLAVGILDTLINQIAFRQYKKAMWYAEKALILHKHLGSSERAAKVLLEGFKSDLSEECKDALRFRANKLANQQNIDLKEKLREELRSYASKEALLESNLPGEHIQKQPVDNYNQRGKLKFEMYTPQGRATVSAEEFCLSRYIHNGQFTQGEHCEGRIVETIFYLLFWDIIYTKPLGVTGVFLNHFQQYPLDMFSESFYVNRKTLIDERLIMIEGSNEDTLNNMVQEMWEQRPEYETSDIHRKIGLDSVRDVTSCLQPRGVAAVCRRLARNYGYTRSGFPDLTLWNLDNKKIKFVEVKTDRDKPSVKQLQWLQYLRQHGIDAGFCYVGTNTTRCRARAPANTDFDDSEDM